jgi:ribosome-associated protein
MMNFPSQSSTPSAPSTSVLPSATAAPDSIEQLAYLIAEAAEDRKGGDIKLIKVGDVSVLADYFVIVTGYSKVQVRAIANAITDTVEERLGRRPRAIEGYTDGSWILVDYGDVIVHVLLPDERDYYTLEAFWGHAEQIPYGSGPTASAVPQA